ncbi:hypothetical protein V8F20_008150 [Naviculisporaceae sp. PSN 640]
MRLLANVYVGIGRNDTSPTAAPNSIVPVAVWSPKPEQICKITPSRVFWIVFGQSVPGLCTSFIDLGPPVKIDFTDRSETTATIDLQSDYTCDAVEFSPATERA